MLRREFGIHPPTLCLIEDDSTFLWSILRLKRISTAFIIYVNLRMLSADTTDMQCCRSWYYAGVVLLCQRWKEKWVARLSQILAFRYFKKIGAKSSVFCKFEELICQMFAQLWTHNHIHGCLAINGRELVWQETIEMTWPPSLQSVSWWVNPQACCVNDSVLLCNYHKTCFKSCSTGHQRQESISMFSSTFR